MSELLNPGQQVEALRAEQCIRWEKGERPLAEELLKRNAAVLAAPAYALEVVYQEILLRERYGETPELVEYVARFPQLAVQLRPLFAVHRALESDEPLHSPGNRGMQNLSAGTQRMQLPIVAGYELLGVLGRGGMAVVYKARQVALNRLVALKMIRGGADAEAKDVARFRAEARALARLQHPNIVQVYEVGEKEGRPYLALEYVEGGSLGHRLAGRPQPSRLAAELVETLARAIHYAHQRGLVHRDLKPANILLRPKADGQRFNTERTYPYLGFSSLHLGVWTPKISDFGLVKLLRTETGQTQSGEIVGTPSYMAPEQAAGNREAVGPATDVHALGAILYELLTGRPPFLADSALNTLLQVRTQEPVRPRRLVPDLPRDLEAICLKCLRKEPAQRYSQAVLLADDLRRFRAGIPVAARPISYSEQLWRWCRRRPALASLAALLTLVAAGALISRFTALMILAATGYAALIGLWLRAQRQRERVENDCAQAEINLARFHERQIQAEMHLLEAGQRQTQAEARAKRAEEQRRRSEQALREHHETVRRQFFLLQRRLAQCHFQLGNSLCQLGRFDEAAESYRRALAQGEQFLSDRSRDVEQLSYGAAVWNNLGETLRQVGWRGESIQAYQQAVEYQRQALEAAPEEAGHRSLLSRYYLNLARRYRELGQWAEAIQACREGERFSPRDAGQVKDLTEELALCSSPDSCRVAAH